MAVDGVTATGGLIGGGTSGNVNVRLDAPVSLLNGGTGVSAFSGTQVANAIGAVPTSGGSMTGNLSMAGGLVVGDPEDGNLGAGTGNFKSLVQVNATDGVTPVLAGTHLHISGDDGARMLSTSYGVPTGQAVVTLRGARGTAADPPAAKALQLGDPLGIIGFMGHHTADFAWTANARIWARTTENQTATNNGSEMLFDTTAVGAIVDNRVARLRIREGLVVGGATGGTDGDMGPGSINATRVCINGVDLGGSAGLPLTGGTLTGPLGINQNSAALEPAPAAQVIQLQVAAADNANTNVFLDAFGTGFPAVHFRHAGGSATTPTATPDNAILAGVALVHGYDGAQFTGNRGSLNFKSDGAWTPTSTGTFMDITLTAPGTVVPDVVMTVHYGTVWMRGDLDVGGTVSPSDRRLKQNIEPWQRGLDEICRLNPISYQYNGLADTVADGKVRVGLDADDTALVIPEMVGERRSSYIDGTPVKTISPGTLTFALINAVKELADRLAAVERR